MRIPHWSTPTVLLLICISLMFFDGYIVKKYHTWVYVGACLLIFGLIVWVRNSAFDDTSTTK
jgi:hypothetical protein